MKKNRFVQMSIISVLGLFIVAPLFISSCDGSDYDEEIDGANTLAPRMMTRAGENSRPPEPLKIYGGQEEDDVGIGDGLTLHITYSWNAGYTSAGNNVSVPKISAVVEPTNTISYLRNGRWFTVTYSILTTHAKWAGSSDIEGEINFITIDDGLPSDIARQIHTLEVCKTVNIVVDTTSVK